MKAKRFVSLLLALSLTFQSFAFAAINAGMVWEVRTGGDDSNNGGGFRGGAFVAAPSAPSVSTSASGGSIAAGTYYFVVTYTDRYGETACSGQTSVTTTGASSTITVTKPSTPPTADTAPAAVWNIYAGTTSGGPYWSQTTGQSLASNKQYTSALASSGTQAPGVDYSQSNSAQVNVDNATITATTAGAASNVMTFTAGYTPTYADVGNCFQATAGTNINAGVYEITAFTSTTWTVTGAANLTTGGGAGSAIVGKMGGAMASPGRAWNFAVTSNTVWVASGTYNLTSSSNAAGGRVTMAGGATALPARFFGYNASRFDWGTKPVLQSNANSITLCTTQNNVEVDNIEFKKANSNTSVIGVTGGGQRMEFRRLKFNTLNSGAMDVGNHGGGNDFIRVIQCEFASCSGGSGALLMQGEAQILNCSFHDNSTVSVYLNTSGITVANCIVVNQSGSSLAAYHSNSGRNLFLNCVAYTVSNGSGFEGTTGGAYDYFINCVVEGAAGTAGFDTATGQSNVLINCAGYNNTVNYTVGSKYQIENFHALTASPFTSGGGNDFSLNTTAGGGAVLRGAGWPTTWAALSTTSYPDIGAAQHADPTTTAGGKKAGPGGGKVGALDVLPLDLDLQITPRSPLVVGSRRAA